MASAVDSRLAYARPSAVATASRLPTANRGSNNSYTTSWDTTFSASRAGNNLSNHLDSVGFGHAVAEDQPSDQPDDPVIARLVLIRTTPFASLRSGDLARKNSNGELPNCVAGAVLQALPANILAGNVLQCVEGPRPLPEGQRLIAHHVLQSSDGTCLLLAIARPVQHVVRRPRQLLKSGEQP